MPTTRRSRTFAAEPNRVWSIVGDAHHLPRWWPRVERVEADGSLAVARYAAVERLRNSEAGVEQTWGRRWWVQEPHPLPLFQ